ncbi:acetyltransferase [Sphaerochaeta pleomorpha str. Grapes]|uniref:Acetyltransferase n=1 Tax=Sphaerochaeta pleomorpha (strain ATCC BAA-1885 / DSM 22778 / Grapes) TaxID=158190 RepID=G8QXM3_SPHPG|nr:GNAT family N-acetyltransferase [Sphaerochaeta pleomorpha]AEV29586.1 acetyltransferase [Sphaerochaeta pleomorpha str. Grapes]
MDAQEILEAHGLLDHVDMLQPLKQGKACVVVADDSGVLLNIKNGGSWILTVFEEREAPKLVSLINHDGRPVCCHQDFCIPLLEAEGYRKDLSCIQAAYLKGQPFNEDPTFSFRKIVLADEQQVIRNYHLVSPSYIHERIVSGVLEGVLLDGELAGFMGCHVEGALGMLEIFPQARRKGLAFALEKHYCNRLLAQGQIPYCNIVKGNNASISLHQKLGFSFSVSDITWFD